MYQYLRNKKKRSFGIKSQKYSNHRKSNVYDWMTEDKQLKMMGFERELRFNN